MDRELEASTESLSQWIRLVASVAHSATSVDEALAWTLKLICEHTGWPVGHIFLVEADHRRLRSTPIWHDDDPVAHAPFLAASQSIPFSQGVGLPGTILATGEPLWIPDLRAEPNFPRAAAATACGLGSGVGFPIVSSIGTEGVMEFFTVGYVEPDPALLDLVAHLGLHLGGVIDRARAKEALEQSEERLRNLVESAPDALIVVDRDGAITLVNEEAERLTGYTRIELLGLHIDALVPDSLQGGHVRHRGHYAGQPQRRAMGVGRDLSLRRRDGGTVAVDISLAPLDASGTGLTVASVRNLSERDRARQEVRNSQARLAEAHRIAHIGTWSWEVGSDSVLWSAELRRIYGLGGEDGPISFPEYDMLVHPEDRDRVNKVLIDAVRRRVAFDHEYRIVLPDGTLRWVHASGDIAEDRDGVPIRLGGYCHDITERREAEARRNRALEDLSDHQRVLESIARDEPLTGTLTTLCLEVEKRLPGAACSVLLVDENDRTLHHAAAPSLPDAFRTIVDGLPIVRGLAPCATAAATGEDVIVIDTLQDPLTSAFLDAAHRFEVRSVWSHPLVGTSGHVIGTFAIYRRVPHTPDDYEIETVRVSSNLAALAIDRKLAETALALAAQVDPLTGLPNRARFLQEVDRRLADGSGRVAVLFLDIDGFKWINDSLGHAAGDRLLVEAATRLERCVTGRTVVARFGGDEFTILLGNASDDRIGEMAENLQLAFDQPFLLDGGEFYLSVSVGIACNDEPTDAYGLVRDSDAAMYSAKEKGRARYAWFDEGLRARAVERVRLESGIRRAIERDEFVMHYQPVADLTRGTWVGAEALARWIQPDEGLTGPGQFIPLAEETGLILPLGAIFIEKSIVDTVRLGSTHPDLCVAVNVSPVQLSDPALGTWIQERLAAHGLAPDRLCLELTESTLMQDFDGAKAVLTDLAAVGCRVVIDDFGTGYSSIARLTELPVTSIKIDQSFTGRLGTDRAVDGVIAAIIDLAHALHIQVVAEGIETADVLRRLCQLGCDMGQGFHLGHPMPFDQVVEVFGRSPEL